MKTKQLKKAYRKGFRHARSGEVVASRYIRQDVDTLVRLFTRLAPAPEGDTPAVKMKGAE